MSPARGETILPFPPLAVGTSPTASAGLATSVVIDAIDDPGVELLATFLPAAAAAGGVRRIAARQIVTATVPIALDELLPISWLASVLRKGDIAPNQLALAYSTAADEFAMPFGELTVAHQGGAWQLPHYDSNAYSVTVGFGIGGSAIVWAYSVPCRPGDSVALAAGGYQLVRSNGEGRIGDPVADDLEAWTMPLGSAYALTFDQCGNGVLSTAVSP